MTSFRSRRAWLFLLACLPGAACSSSSASENSGAPDGGTGAPDARSQARESAAGGADVGAADHDGGGADPDGTTSSDTGQPPSAPTVSTWMGTNVDVDLPFVDVTRLLAGFNTPAAQLDANGYPVAGASGTSQSDVGFLLPTGTYNISFVGKGSLTVSGIGSVTGTWQTANGEQRNTVKITGTPGSFGNTLTLAIANSGTETVTSIHLYLPGTDYDATDPFNPEFLKTLAPFRAMRFMGWLSTNNSTLADWADRPSPTSFGSSSFGYSYELVADLINETGKDGWINVPQLATSDFITQYAALMAKNLDFTKIAAARKAAGFTTPFQLIVENSNENWNSGFTAYKTFLATAQANPSRYTGKYTGSYGPSFMTSDTDLMQVGEVEADRLVAIGNAFKTAFKAVGQESVVAPVLAGWSLGPAYSDDGLTFIQSNYGDPKNYVSYVALAPYFATADDTTTGSLAEIFPALQANITSNDATFTSFEMLSKAYGIPIAAYEGGQGLTGSTNQQIKHLAQFDQRMYETYTQYLTFWKSHFGESLFMHFDLSGNPGQPENIYQYGFWGSLTGVEQDLSTCGKNFPTLTGTETIASVTPYCPKYQALADRVPN